MSEPTFPNSSPEDNTRCDPTTEECPPLSNLIIEVLDGRTGIAIKEAEVKVDQLGTRLTDGKVT